MEPLIRWAGSKRKLLPLLRRNLPKNFKNYIEPFCGSACLYFDILPDKAILGDINKDLIICYKTIKKNHKKVMNKLSGLYRDSEEYMRLRDLDPEDLNDIDRTYRFIYLNRFSFNGVYRTNKQGKFNVPMGSRTGNLPTEEKLSSCSKALSHVKLVHGDFNETLRYAQKGDFVYIDPPYTKLGVKNRGEYGVGSFDYHNLPDLFLKLKELDKLGANFLLSYRHDDDFLECIPNNWAVLDFNVDRHVAGFKHHRKSAREILVANYELGEI